MVAKGEGVGGMEEGVGGVEEEADVSRCELFYME